MSTTRVMVGLEDLTGRQVGTLRVGQMVGRRPQPRYRTYCQCGSEGTETQARLQSGAARCMSSTHDRSTKKRERLEESERIAAQRQAELEAAQLQASIARMEAETEGFERATKYAPTPSKHTVMSERDRLALRERRESEEIERREAERPRLEAEHRAAQEREAAEAAQRERGERRRAYEAEWISSDRDPKLFVSDAMRNAKLPTKDAEAFTAKAAAQFAAEPEYAPYRSLENADVILSYLRRNGVFIADIETIRAAFHRLRDVGLLKEKPAPVATLAPQPRPVNRTVSPEPPKPNQPKLIDGWDLITGEPRKWTPRELDRLSADDYRRALHLYKDDLELPNVGPGPRRSDS